MTTRATLGFRVLGSADGRRNLVSYGKALALYADADPVVRPDIPAFLSNYSFPAAIRRHVEATGGTKGYAGPVGIPALRWDIDRDGDPDAALRDVRRLAGHLADRYGDRGLSVHFSGSKGYHVEADTGGAVEPADDAHLIARQVAESIAGAIRLRIDTGVYDRVRLWRAPNSRHPRTGLFKVLVELDDLTHATTEGVRRRAVEPIPYDLPNLAVAPPQFLDDWRQAERAVRVRDDQRGVRRQGTDDGTGRVNTATMDLIRRPDQVEVGDRHRRLFSAAANLAENGTVEALIIALLTEPGRDTGLPPREVERQIRCGIDHGRRSGEGGAS